MAIVLEDEKSSSFKDVLIKIGIAVGFTDIYWHPIIIKKLLNFFAHNDIMNDQIIKDIGLLNEISLSSEKKINENLSDQQKNKEKTGLLTCSEFKYIYINVHTYLEEIKINLIQPVLNLNLYELKILAGNLIAEMYVDHFKIYGSLDDFEIQELTNYPYTIKTQEEFDENFKKPMLSTKKKESLEFNFLSKTKICQLFSKEDNITSETFLKIKKISLYFYQESFLRFFNYLISEFLGSLGPSQKIVEYRKSKEKPNLKKRSSNYLKQNINSQENYISNHLSVKSNGINELNSKKENWEKNHSDEFNKNIEFMKLNIEIENPILILKARPSFNEFFNITLKKLLISCAYRKKFGLIRKFPELFRYISIYKLFIEDFCIKSHDKFYICEPTNTIVNMQFTMLSDKDIKKSDLKIDKSFRFDVIINPIKIMLRQVDFKNIMMLNDLNLSYSDGQTESYDYAKFYNEINEKKIENKKDNFNNEKNPSDADRRNNHQSIFKKEVNNKNKINISKSSSNFVKESKYGSLLDNEQKISSFKSQKYIENSKKNISFKKNNTNEIFIIKEKNFETEEDHFSEAFEESELKEHLKNIEVLKIQNSIENNDKPSEENNSIIIREKDYRNSEIDEIKAEKNSINKLEKDDELMEKFYDMNFNLLIDQIEIKLIIDFKNEKILNNFAGLKIDRLFLKFIRKLNKNQYMKLYLNEISVNEKNTYTPFDTNFKFNKYKKEDQTKDIKLVFNNQTKNEPIENLLNTGYKSLTYENIIQHNHSLGISRDDLDNLANKNSMNRSFDELENSCDFNEIANEIIQNFELNYYIKMKNKNKKKFNNKKLNYFNQNVIKSQENEITDKNTSNMNINMNTKNEIDKSLRNSIFIKSERELPNNENKSNKFSQSNPQELKDKFNHNIIKEHEKNVSHTKKLIIREFEKLKKNLLLLRDDNYNSYFFNQSEVNLQMKIDSERNKFYDINLNNLKILVKLDNFLLIKQFFLEGFPFYSISDNDLPLLYEGNEDKNPGMFLKLFIQNPKLCILTDEVINEEQDIICLTSDIVIEMKTEKIISIKKQLFEKYTSNKNKLESNLKIENNSFIIENKNLQQIKIKENIFDHAENPNIFHVQKSYLDNNAISEIVYKLTINCNKMHPYILKFFDFMNPTDSENEKIRRKIIEDFEFIYYTNSELILNKTNDFFFNSSSFTEMSFNDSNFFLKASYRDIVLFLKAFEYNSKLLTSKDYEKKIELMKSYSNSKSNKKSEVEYMQKKKNDKKIDPEKMAKVFQKYMQDKKLETRRLGMATLMNLKDYDTNSYNLSNTNKFKSLDLKEFFEKNNEIYNNYKSGKTIPKAGLKNEDYDSDQDENIANRKNVNNQSFDSNEDAEIENNIKIKNHDKNNSKLLDEEKNSMNNTKNINNTSNYHSNNTNNPNNKFKSYNITVSNINEDLACNNILQINNSNQESKNNLFEKKFNSNNTVKNPIKNFYPNNLIRESNENANSQINNVENIILKNFDTEIIKTKDFGNTNNTKKSNLLKRGSKFELYNTKRFLSSSSQKRIILNREIIEGALNKYNLNLKKLEIIKMIKNTNFLDFFSEEDVDKQDIMDYLGNEVYDFDKDNDEEDYQSNCKFKLEKMRSKDFQEEDLERIPTYVINNINTIMKFKKIEVMLIDDHSDHYYPFFLMKFKNINIINNSQMNKTDYLVDTEIKLKTFNYIANLWEPLLEMTFLQIKYIYSKQVNVIDKEKIDLILAFMNGEKQAKLDLNISDLTVKFKLF